jgi:DHA2 family multidrug resistance protein
MGTSIATTLWEDRAQLHRSHLVEQLAAGGPGGLDAALAPLQAAGLDRTQAAAMVSRLIDQQAFTRSFDDICLVSSFIFVALMAMVWLTRRPGRPAGAGPGGGAH